MKVDNIFDCIDDRIFNRVIYSPVCAYCANLISGLDDTGAAKCAAFERIPKEIWIGDNDHRRPYPGDHGIQFKPKSEL